MLTNSVFRIDLADYATEQTYGPADFDGNELDRQLNSMLPILPLGTSVRLIVHRYPPHPLVCKMLRHDLMVQVESPDPWILAGWVSELSQEEGAA